MSATNPVLNPSAIFDFLADLNAKAAERFRGIDPPRNPITTDDEVPGGTDLAEAGGEPGYPITQDEE